MHAAAAATAVPTLQAGAELSKGLCTARDCLTGPQRLACRRSHHLECLSADSSCQQSHGGAGEGGCP